jgi:hypothetical protein
MNILPRRNQLPSTDDVAHADIVFAENQHNDNSNISRYFSSLLGETNNLTPSINPSRTLDNYVRPAPFIPPDSQILTGVVVSLQGEDSSTRPR